MATAAAGRRGADRAERRANCSVRGSGTFDGSSEATATPAVASGLIDDVYVSLESDPNGTGPKTPVSLGVFVQPLIIWLWIGGGLMGLGSLLAVVPGRRRRPTDPSSVPLPELLEPLEPVGVHQ